MAEKHKGYIKRRCNFSTKNLRFRDRRCTLAQVFCDGGDLDKKGCPFWRERA